MKQISFQQFLLNHHTHLLCFFLLASRDTHCRRCRASSTQAKRAVEIITKGFLLTYSRDCFQKRKQYSEISKQTQFVVVGVVVVVAAAVELVLQSFLVLMLGTRPNIRVHLPSQMQWLSERLQKGGRWRVFENITAALTVGPFYWKVEPYEVFNEIKWLFKICVLL